MVYLIGGYWRYTFSKIEIITNDTLDYDIIKIYFSDDHLAEEFRIKKYTGVEWVYKHVLKQYTAVKDRKIPTVVFKDIITTVNEYILEV